MPQHDAFFDTLEMDLQLQQRVQDEQLEEELLERVGAFRAAECACARHGGEFWREARQPTSYPRAHVPHDEFSWLEKSRTRRVRPNSHWEPDVPALVVDSRGRHVYAHCGVCFAGHSFLEELQQQRLLQATDESADVNEACLVSFLFGFGDVCGLKDVLEECIIPMVRALNLLLPDICPVCQHVHAQGSWCSQCGHKRRVVVQSVRHTIASTVERAARTPDVPKCIANTCANYHSSKLQLYFAKY